MYFWLLMKTINIISHVSVYGKYLFYLIAVYPQNIFHLTDGIQLYCARAFICWMKSGFSAFIHTHITTTFPFIIFRCAQSFFFSLIIIHTQIFFMFIRFPFVRNSFVGDLSFLPIHQINYRLNLLYWHVQLFCWRILFFQSPIYILWYIAERAYLF